MSLVKQTADAIQNDLNELNELQEKIFITDSPSVLNLTDEEVDNKEPPKSISLFSRLEQNAAKSFHHLVIESNWLCQNKVANKIILFILISALGWLLFLAIVGARAMPGGLYFSLVIVLIAGHLFGFLFEKLKMPSLLGIRWS